jgi:hypothetical protein
MKKERAPKPSSGGAADELRAEYRFDYSQAKPNRFAHGVMVPLDPDVAQVFTTPESVNKVLRALIASMPGPPRRKSRT